MKNLSFIVILLICLFVACDAKQNNGNQNFTGDNNISIGDIAYINMDSLVDKYDYYNDLRTQLLTKQNAMEQDLQTKSKSLERKMMELQSNYEKRLITPTRAQELQQQYVLEQQRLLQQRDNGAMELADDQQKITSMVYDSIQSYVNKYNSDKAYKMIISNSYGGVLIYADKSFDITQDILKLLNDGYKVKE